MLNTFRSTAPRGQFWKGCLLVAILILSILYSLNINYAASPNQDNAEENPKSTAYLTQYKATANEIQRLKNTVGVYNPQQNYSQIIDGHGTGLAPPTEQEWANITENLYVTNSAAAAALPSNVDWSKSKYFPPIGNQGSQGSCASWATIYYVKTFQEAKEHSWDLSGATWSGEQPTLNYQDKIMSPAFAYHLLAGTQSVGMSFETVMSVVYMAGVCSWQKMPYNASDWVSWPSEAAWREAPYYRSETGAQTVYFSGGIDGLKDILAQGNLAMVIIDAYSFNSLSSTDLWTLDNYNPSSNSDGWHAGTVVGYDDNITYTEAGQTRQGAFKLANSWGVGGWEKVADGFYYISYEAMKQRVQLGSFYYDRIGYQPTLLAEFSIEHQKRNDCFPAIILGPTDNPIDKKLFPFYAGSYPYPANNIIYDISEFQTRTPNLTNQHFSLEVQTRYTAAWGKITYFAIGQFEATDTPIQMGAGTTGYSTLLYAPIKPVLSVSPNTGGPSAPITLNGKGFTPGSNLNLAYLNPTTSTWTSLGTTTATSGNFSFSTQAPDLKQCSLPGDQPATSNRVVFRAQEGTGQSCNATYEEMKRGLTQIGNRLAGGLFGNNSDLSAYVSVADGQTLTIAGKWFSPGTATLLLDDSSLGSASVDATGSFSATVTIPQVPAGKHTVTIQDGNAPLCFTLTYLPTISVDYADVWHTQDFNINLNPELALTQTCYRINNGSIRYVNSDGQPKIVTEGADNCLEYWGVWSVNDLGSIELQHQVLFGIKLDKTAPIGGAVCDNSVSSPTVSLALSAYDSNSGVDQMRFSNDNVSWSAWEPYAVAKSWSLQGGDGQKTVYVQFHDRAGLTSQVSSVNILLQANTPTISPTPTSMSTPNPTVDISTPTPTSQATNQATKTANPTQMPSGTPDTPSAPELSLGVLMLFMGMSLAVFLLFKWNKRSH